MSNVVKVSEAPRSGWYPDPEGGSRLRWWDGGDWSDRYRTRPDESATQRQATAAAAAGGLDTQTWGTADIPETTQAVVDQVRMAARQEAHYAAQEFERRAREITGSIPPLISQYTNKFVRFVRIGLTLAIIVLVIWFGYQLWVQKSIFDWIGDRIDNLTDQNAAAVVISRE
jgi:hypothetical protein